MKNSFKALLLASAMALSVIFCTACGNEREGQTTEVPVSASVPASNQTEAQNASIWDSAEYTEDAEFGGGAAEIKVEVKAEDKSVILTLHTDKDTLGAALQENGLVPGDESEFGLYIKFVIGMEADYDKDGTYWSLSKDGESLMTGADSTPITDGEHYELTRTAG